MRGPPKRAAAPARHCPCDLRPGPRLRHDRRDVVDLSLRDLTGLLVGHAHVPAAALRAEATFRRVGLVRRVGAPPVWRVTVEPVRDLVVCDEDRGRASLCEVLLGLGERGRGGCSRDECQAGDRDDDAGNQPQCCLRNDQSLLPTKFAGVTSTIAIAWETILPRPTSTRTVRIARFPA